jgi:SRSO17 transposase
LPCGCISLNIKRSTQLRAQAKVPESILFETKGDIALAQIDIALTDGVHFGMVLADAGYGSSAEFRAGPETKRAPLGITVMPLEKTGGWLNSVQSTVPKTGVAGCELPFIKIGRQSTRHHRLPC